ncbi:MAG: YXWGXW repeat-containing protein [Alphaproteobacteria bacterium]|nr:YXWGXW repeat-containing protein [Alphaproteobacteria bacterium]
MRKLHPIVLAIFLGFGVAAVSSPAKAQVGIGIFVNFAPPPLPVYDQPPCPGYGYIWTPGYWAWDDDDDDYYWVPGTWVLPPLVGMYWTPGYWAFDDEDDEYAFYTGYWGPSVGFYGGIDYGFGYDGYGYEGGYWRDDRFYYNSTVNNVSETNITTVYNRTVINNSVNNVSYNGGRGGVQVRPTPQQLAVARGRHIDPTPMQREHLALARRTPDLRVRFNHGAPPIAATMRPAVLHGAGIVGAAHAGRGFTDWHPARQDRFGGHPASSPWMTDHASRYQDRNRGPSDSAYGRAPRTFDRAHGSSDANYGHLEFDGRPTYHRSYQPTDHGDSYARDRFNTDRTRYNEHSYHHAAAPSFMAPDRARYNERSYSHSEAPSYMTPDSGHAFYGGGQQFHSAPPAHQPSYDRRPPERGNDRGNDKRHRGPE